MFEFAESTVPFKRALVAVTGSDPSHPDTPLDERARALGVSTLRALIEALPLGVIVVTAQGEVLYANAEALRITRRDRWPSLNHPRSYLLRTPRGEVLDQASGPFQRAVRQRRELEQETLLLDFGAGETRRVVCQVRQVDRPGEDEALYMCMMRDITARHEREQRKDEFLSVASHELRGPLTPLKGLLQIARQQHEQGRPVDGQLLTKALGQIERLRRLVDGLLDLSRMETGRLTFTPQPTDLVELVREQVELWCARHGHGRFELDLPEAPLIMELDASGIGQVLNNLLDNALKFSPEDEAIRVGLSTESDPWVTLTIEDHGVGLDPELGERVFERFFQGPNAISAGSLGLGLFISRKIIQEHNGKIKFRSYNGERTVVEVLLPMG